MRATMDFVQGMLVGSLLGAGVGGHALRLVTLGWGEMTPRHWVAWSAVVLYGLSALLVAVGAASGAWIAIVGPMIGLTAVVVTGNKVDAFQAVLGVFQLVSLGLAVWWLWHR